VLLLAHSFGYALQFLDLLTVVSFAIFAAVLPLSFNGWGVREGAMMLGMSILAVNRDAALMISFLYGVGLALASLPGSVSWLPPQTAALRKKAKTDPAMPPYYPDARLVARRSIVFTRFADS
jgi:uncharacterized membrane protein YbhN (UPF0104 family)